MKSPAKPVFFFIVVDVFINVFMPIITGIILYRLPIEKNIIAYLPDGLWAYSFTSCMLIVWSRKINIYWLSVVAFFFILFEILQQHQFIEGTGDLIDILVYFFSGALALIANPFFKRLIQNHSRPDKQ